MSIECGCWYVGVNNFGKNRVKRRRYFEVAFWCGDKWFEYIKQPVSGGHCTGLHIGPVHIWWGGWRVLNWD